MENIKRSFIRGIWGIYDNQNVKAYTRRPKIDNDIQLSLVNPYAPKCKVYVFGEDNFKKLTDMGFDTLLIDKKPICWDMQKEQYRHKIEIWKYGLVDYDEVVFLDWDCVPLCPIPKDFWDNLAKGPKIQATIYMYKLRRAFFRPSNERKLSASTFVYMREKDIANKVIETWERVGRPWQEEIALSKYIDELDGGWKGIDNYKKYEPLYHILFWHYDKKFYSMVKPIFFHYNYVMVRKALGGRTPEGVKKCLDALYQMELVNFDRAVKKINDSKRG